MNKNLILGIGLLGLAIYLYRKNNVKPSVAPTGTSSMCGSCSGADGENWN
jgi:hypothetical protein